MQDCMFYIMITLTDQNIIEGYVNKFYKIDINSKRNLFFETMY